MKRGRYECEFCGKPLKGKAELLYGEYKVMYLDTPCFKHLFPTQAGRDKLFARGEHKQVTLW